MRISHLLFGLALCPLLALGAVDSGTWGLAPAEQGQVQFSLQGSKGSHHFDTSSDWALTDLRGLDWTTTAKHDVHFSVVRDAGAIDCQGFVQEQRGAGLFTFTPNPQYVQEMQKLGYSFRDDQLFSAATFDVSFEFARALKVLGVQGLDAEKLMAFRIHGVNPEFVRELRSEGLKAADAEKLIAFRIHGVTPEFVKGLRAAGVSVGNEEQLVAFRIHGVSPQFVGDLSHLGYSHPPAEQLIALRIHGVTPEYIESLRSKGLHDLTLEQLVNMRIHGVD